MPYTIFHPGNYYYEPFQDWFPSYGIFERSRPRPRHENSFFPRYFTTEMYPERCFETEYRRRQPTRSQRVSTKRNNPNKRRGSGSEDMKIEGGRLGQFARQQSGAKIDNRLKEECQPQNNLRLNEGLNEFKDIKKPGGGELEAISKITQNNSRISPTDESVKKEISSSKKEFFEEDNLEAASSEENEENLVKLCDVEEDKGNINKEETGEEFYEEKMGANSSSMKERKLKLIGEIGEEVKKLSEKVQELKGDEKMKELVYLEEMLTKCLLKLDDISTEGEEDVRKSRKGLVEKINCELQNVEEKIEVKRDILNVDVSKNLTRERSQTESDNHITLEVEI
eukprot:gene183-796_t